MSKNNIKEEEKVEEEVLENTSENLQQNEEEKERLDNEVNQEPTNEESPEETLQKALDNEKDRNLRLFAEFENFKKRTAKERIELFKTAGQDIVTAILPVLDDFDRALGLIKKEEVDSHVEGMKLIHTKLKEALKSKGLEEIKTKKGDTFNADLHEAITQIPAPSKKLKGKIIDTVEKGYQLGEKIIRYPKVVIGQ